MHKSKKLRFNNNFLSLSLATLEADRHTSVRLRYRNMRGAVEKQVVRQMVLDLITVGGIEPYTSQVNIIFLLFCAIGF